MKPREATILRLGIAGVLAWSAGGKLLWFGAFRDMLGELGMIPPALTAPIAAILPGFELAIAVGLALGIASGPILILTTFLAGVFVGVHGYLLWTGRPVPCGCAGLALVSDSKWSHVAMMFVSLGMLAGSLRLLLSQPTKTRRMPDRGAVETAVSESEAPCA